jgi:PAS domain S-box-containing protein
MTDTRREALARMALFRGFEDAVVAFACDDASVLAVNPATESMFSWHGMELVGCPVGVLFVDAAPDGGVPPHLLDGDPAEVIVRRADGTTFVAEAVVAEVAVSEGSFRLVLLRDCTRRTEAIDDLQRSEARFRAAVEALGEVVLFTTTDDVAEYANPRLEPLTGFAPAAVVGRPLEDWLVPEAGRAAWAEHREVRNQGLTDSFEARLCRRDGSTFWAEVQLAPFLDRREAVVGGLVAIADVSERKRIEDDLVRAIDLAEDATRAKSAFLANMSHELRTPLNAIIGYSEMIREEVEDAGLAEVVGDVERIRTAGKHLLALINDILDLSKIEAGRMDLVLESFDVGRLLADVESTAAPLAQRKEIELRFEGAGLGAMRADTTRLRQVLLNLLGNAIKFTESGGVTLRARREARPGGDVLHFGVSDTGIGLSPKQLAKLFQPFTQADASTTRKYGGTGLGLAISRQICRLMGGDIAVTSQVGRGSTFTVTLPAEVRDPRAS